MSAPHVVPLHDGWALWRWTCLRATGFPARRVLELASPELAAAADLWAAEDAREASARQALIAACEAGIAASDPDSRALHRTIKALGLGRMPEAVAAGPVEELRAQLVAAAARSEAARREVDAVYSRAHRTTSEAIRRIATDDRFRQALLWQNRTAITTGVASLLRQPVGASDTKARANERLVASYVQRYTVKNDTIGFFGPVGWARFSDARDALAQRPGLGLIAASAVYYEYWAIDALAARLARDPALRPYLVPRLLPRFRLDGTTLHHPVDRRSELPAEFAAVLARCDGERTAREIAAGLVAAGAGEPSTTGLAAELAAGSSAELAAELAAGPSAELAAELTDGPSAELAAELVGPSAELAAELAVGPSAELASEDAVLALLDELAETGVITWTLEIPTHGAHPEHALAALLARIDDPELRARAETSLAALETRRADVAAARDATALDAALREFDATFRAEADTASERAAGQTYAARTPLYLDCRRDLDVELGRPLLDRLGPPLALVLASARWYTHEIAARYRRALDQLFDQVRAGRDELDHGTFWPHVPALFPGAGAKDSIVATVRAELQARWATLLAITPDERAQRRVHRRAADLAAAAHRAFAAPGPGWPAARHQSPDLMIAADGPDAIACGELQFVLGELHCGMNTVSGPLFVKDHPNPAELVAARAADLPETCIAPVWSKAVTRADFYSPSPHDVDLETGDTRSPRPRTQVVSTGELVVARRDGRIEVRTRDGRLSFDIIAFLEHHLIAESFATFSLVPGAPVTPRVTIDDLVISRTAWRFAPHDVTWSHHKEPAGRFLGARRWARSHGMPRFVFVRTPEEVKPVFVDLDSTVFVENLAKQVRDASAVTVSEMLPTAAQTWILDGDGHRYCGELRIAAVDPARWAASDSRDAELRSAERRG